ncbi:class I SAM-dependent methyltransferase [Methylovorus mays]|uniref:class I SAM-dependent methyltransferase n=1 Tax=Methylovorus mays TaxID=184077 RepID=UPI001E28879D|nr:class I SAM-dependent methyltransferase [Methylovorus mays]MCB5207100.1 class I SAM-dependent methyltransferase [Methylovorus mays]
MSDLIIALEKLGVLHRDRLEVYYPRVRDREDVAVLRDAMTEVIVLSRCDHVSETYYAEREEKNSYSVHGADIVTPRLEDNVRRAAEFGGYIRNKRWLDFGCGLGGMLDEMASEAAWAAGLEPSRERAAIVSAKGHNVVNSMDAIEDNSLDIVTLFHVFEHLTEPLEVLRSLRRVLRPEGMLLIEVPHARDALFTLYDCEAFKRFTFWSEHLILHTRESLKTLLQAAGYQNAEIAGYQRYPLANHLYWLSKQKPGGHEKWAFMAPLERGYQDILAGIDATDSLVAIGYK